MPINITVKTPDKPQRIISLNARKAINGDIMIFDHKILDIVVIVEKKKVVAFAKDSFGDEIYNSQDRLFEFLRKKGIIVAESVQAGNVYGSMEATLNKPSEEDVSSINSAILSIYNFLNEEQKYYDSVYDDYEDQEIDYLTDPEAEDSTELGEVPHEEKKGSLIPGYVRGPYGMTTFYRY